MYRRAPFIWTAKQPIDAAGAFRVFFDGRRAVTTGRIVGSCSAGAFSCRAGGCSAAHRDRRRALPAVRQRHARRPRPGALRSRSTSAPTPTTSARRCGPATTSSPCSCTSTASTRRGTKRRRPVAAGVRRRRTVLRRQHPLRRHGRRRPLRHAVALPRMSRRGSVTRRG